MIGIGSTRYRHRGTPGVWQRVQRVVRYSLELIALHGRLAEVDFREWRSGLAVIAAMIAGGVALALGTIPVLVYCFGAALQIWTGMNLILGLLISCVLFIAIGTVLFWIGCNHLTASFAKFDRTRSELARNVEWLKGRMAHDSEDDYSVPLHS